MGRVRLGRIAPALVGGKPRRTQGCMTNGSPPALTPEQWETRDYRQPARDLDQWAQAHPGAADDDATEYVAKLGLSESGSVIVMSRAHDRILVPPPARAALAAFALA